MVKQEIIDRIMNETDIVEVISSYIQLTPKGKNYWGVCPFHNDNNPSMSVSREKHIFNCFSCHTKGNVVTFLMKYENISYQNAIAKLAERLGIEINNIDDSKFINKKRQLNVMKEASKFYEFYLDNATEGEDALKYLNKRGISKEIKDKFKIGLAPSGNNFLNLALNEANIDFIDQVELGLVRQNEQGEIYDVFRRRIMFPVSNAQGDVVGFSGRIYIDNDRNAKYVNSIENDIFHKSECLYNFYNASKVARKVDKIYVFEGFMDVIAAEKANIENTVATMGTALTTEHLKLLLSVTKNIVFCFDGDNAGINATKKAAEIFATTDIIPNAVALPDNLDPDEYLTKYGAKALNDYLSNNIINIYEYLYQIAKKELIISDIASVDRFKRSIYEIIQKSKSVTLKEFYIKKLSQDLDIDFDTIVSDFGKLVIAKPSQKEESFTIENRISPKIVKAYDVVLKHSLYDIERYKEYYNYKQIGEAYAGNGLITYFAILLEIKNLYVENPKINIDKLIETFGKDSIESKIIQRVISDKMIDLENIIEFKECLETIYKDISKSIQKNLRDRANNDDDTVAEYLEYLKKTVYFEEGE